MTYQSYLALVNKVNACPEIVRDPQAFQTEMADVEAADPDGFAALCAAVGAPELANVEYRQEGIMFTDEQQEHNAQLAQELAQRLFEQGLEPHAALWAVHCWMNALAWPYYEMLHGYDATVEGMTVEEREALVMRGDGFSAFSLAEMYDKAGDSARAAHYYKAALDCCSLEAMRSIEYAAAESGAQPAGYGQLLARHASLGDPEGMAAYALHLIHQNPEENREKALRLAYQSADMGSCAGEYAVYECIYGMDHKGYDVDTLAVDSLNTAADFHHPRACFVRALRRDADGRYEDAYRDLLLSVRNGRLYPAVYDGAYLLARYCLEGKGGAAQNAQKAYEWAQSGAQRGSMIALGMLGAMEMQGIGTQQDLEGGAQHIGMAADGGDEDSVHRMELMVRCGVNAEAVRQRAVEYVDRVIVERRESADGLGFAWISALCGMNNPQEAMQEAVQEEPAAYESAMEEAVPVQMEEAPQADRQMDWEKKQAAEPELAPDDGEAEEICFTPTESTPDDDWGAFKEPAQQEPVQEAPVDKTPAQEEEDEEDDDIYLLPEELERLKAQEEEEARQQAMLQMQPQAYAQPEPVIPAQSAPQMPAQDTAFDPVEMQTPRTPCQDNTPGLLLYCISSVWDRLDEEMIRMTGEPASDEMLVDMLLACLCGMLVAFEDEERKKQVYHGVLAEFDRRMPDFAQVGYDRRVLDSRYRTLAQIMHEIRMQLYEQAERDGAAYTWDAVCAVECSVMNGIIDQLMKPSEALAEVLADAVQTMFRDLTRELSANE